MLRGVVSHVWEWRRCDRREEASETCNVMYRYRRNEEAERNPIVLSDSD